MSKLSKCRLFWILFLISLFGVYTTVNATDSLPQKNPSPETDVILVVDNSKSIWNRQQIRNDAMKAAVNVMIGSDIRIGCVYFAREVYSVHSLSKITDEADYKDKCMKYLDKTDKDPDNIDTNIGKGLQSAISLFDLDSNSRKVIVLLSDGINENASDDKKFKNDADNLTEEQAKRLYDEGIEIHCISINGRNDEDYLKRLVNYFRDTNEYDERFTSVSPQNIDELYDEFTKKFYSFRGDIKYNIAELDSDNSCTFSVPKLAVSRLQVYIRGKDITPDLKCTSSNAKVKEWSVGQSKFLTVDSPPVGEWILNLLSKNKKDLDNVKVMIAYYTDLSASVSIEPVNTPDILRGHEARLKVRFLNGKNEPVRIDPAAIVTANVTTVNNTLSLTVNNRNEDYDLFSDDFIIEDIGKISVDINLKYGKNIDMDYSFDNVASVVPHAPEIIRKYSNDTIKAEKIRSDSGNKYLFRIPLEEYVRDPDSDISELKISNIHQYSEKNSFDAHIENERIVIEAENWGSINGTIELEDGDGEKAKLEIEGSIQNMDMANIILAFSGFFVFCVVAFWTMIFFSHKRKEREKNEINENISDALNELNKSEKEINEKKIAMYETSSCDEYIDVKKQWDAFCEDSNVSGDIKKCVENIFFPDIVLFEGIKGRINDFNNSVKEYNRELDEKLKNIKENKADLSFQKLKDCSNDYKNKIINEAKNFKGIGSNNDGSLNNTKEDVETNNDNSLTTTKTGIETDIKKLKSMSELMEQKMKWYRENAIPCSIRAFKDSKRYFVKKPSKNSLKWLIVFDDLLDISRHTARENSGESNIYFLSDQQEISVKDKNGREKNMIVPVVRVIHITNTIPEYENEIMRINESKTLYSIKIELEE